ncbi:MULTISPECIES: FtsL-like putative cell division protein [unclassified Zunongwangia]|uniref:FtsL-like putative cell division protein n=1 Tax=unclassified Zunongwangia TaxID=2632541 RepID=UPI0022DE0470|nr:MULTISPECIES: FtsL-like putative cell division protein [unclassified Zunongwangia]WBL21807.1 FtsL-like putative cell division protein [Zunongwangia sp. HRR-M8]WBL27367.1 FtsL-like putative cell division protein [Zunongwangia sp. HGR-M22]
MKKGFYNILKANFLINDDAFKNWRFIVFCTVLAIIMIASSHSAERKVHEIARLHEDVLELRSEFLEGRSNLMKIKMESTVTNEMKKIGVGPSDNPPYKLKVKISE